MISQSLIIGSCLAAVAKASTIPTIDLTSAAAVGNATLAAAAILVSYYSPNELGAIASNGASDASSIQWYESGIMWETVMRVTKFTGDPRFVENDIEALVNASYGGAADFLGPAYYRALASDFLGEWNDDVMWWAMAPITGAEIFSLDTDMPNGGTFFNLSSNTLTDVWGSWDNSTCNGGIFWSRVRDSSASSAQQTLKSTITNTQFISMAARLYILTQDNTYLKQSIQVYQWLRNIGLATPQGLIYDGGNAPTCTGFSTSTPGSYLYGQLIEGLSNLYIATGNATYLADAQLYATSALSLYTVNSVLTDLCEPNTYVAANVNPCWPTNVSPKGILIRGLYTLYPLAPASFKAKIKTAIDASLAGMLQTCTSEFACGNYWSETPLVVYSDFHTQLNAVELLIAATVIYAPLTTPTKLTLDGNVLANVDGASTTTATSSSSTVSASATIIHKSSSEEGSYFTGLLAGLLSLLAL